MQQHKPKLKDRVGGNSYGFGTDDNVIIQEPGETYQGPIESVRRTFASLGLRVLSLAFSLFLAGLFLSHYQLAGGASPLESFKSITGIFILTFGIVFAGVDIWRRASLDRVIPVDQLQGQLGRILFRPVIRYLSWTFIFFVFSGLGHNIYVAMFAAFMIAVRGTGLRFDRKQALGFSSSFSSFNFRR